MFMSIRLSSSLKIYRLFVFDAQGLVRWGMKKAGRVASVISQFCDMKRLLKEETL